MSTCQRKLFALMTTLAVGMASSVGAVARDFGVLGDQDWRLLESGPAVATGPKQRAAIQIVFDPNCPASANLFNRLAKTHTSTAIRWVPIAYYQRTSAGKAMSILADADPAAALTANFERYDFQAQQGAGTMVEVSPGLAQRMRSVRRQLDTWFGGTPLIVVRTDDGRVLMNNRGNQPQHVDGILALAGGLKAYGLKN
jgi:hypothetical protein